MEAILRGATGFLSRLAPPSSTEVTRSSPSDTARSAYLSPLESNTSRDRGRDRGRVILAPPSSASSTFSDDLPVSSSPPPPDVDEPFVLPRIVFNAEPAMKVKLRKRVHPLGVTRLTLGADLDLHTREVVLTWDWRERLFGGRVRFEGSQVSVSKRFNLDGRSKLWVKAAFDVSARKTLFSMDVRPFEGISAAGGKPGFGVRQRVPLDKHVAAEVVARVELPEARFASDRRISLGEGDVIVHVDEFNLRLHLE